MASLGAPRYRKFPIGTAELRVGPMSSAMKLLQASSIGLLDNVTVNIAQTSVDLLGGFPRKLVDTAIVDQQSTLTATLREYSRRNLQIMLGNGVAGSNPTDVATTVATAAAAAAVSLPVTLGTGILPGDLIVIYPPGKPENVQVLIVDAVVTNTVTLNAGTPILIDTAVGDIVYVAKQVAIGATTQTNYFAVMIVQKENATGRAIGFHFWKAAISAGLEYGTNAENFASTNFQLKMLEPAAAEYGSGGSLLPLASIIPTHPVGMLFQGGDQ